MSESVDNEVLLLPHEVHLVRARYTSAQNRLDITATSVQEAMSQSSETWHDNAPADAALEEHAKAKGLSFGLAHMIKNHTPIAYPDKREISIGVGSTTLIDIPRWGERLTVLIAGDARNLYPEPHRDFGVDEILSYKSPIGSALMGHISGDRTEALINSEGIELVIVSVDQLAVHSIASAILKNLE